MNVPLVIRQCLDKVMEMVAVNVWLAILMLNPNFVPLVGIMFLAAYSALPTQYVQNATPTCN